MAAHDDRGGVMRAHCRFRRGVYLKHEQTVKAEALPNAGRIQRIEGEVAFNDALSPGLQNNDDNAQWTAASNNQSFSVGDRSQ